MRRRVRFVHPHAAEARQRAASLRAAGYTVDATPLDATALRRLRNHPPAACVIDLSHQPSFGRDVAVAMRQAKGTRSVPLVFVDGAPETVAAIRRLLPDAAFVSWGRIRSALREAVAGAPASPVVPGSVFAGYAGTPLPKKLGITPGAIVGLVDAPPAFEETLGPLPDGAALQRQPRGRRDLTLWFARTQQDVRRRMRQMMPHAAGGRLWICWPKKSSGVPSDLSEREVREAGLAAGLVDFKICAVDATWSGLRFTRPRARATLAAR